MLAVSYLSLRGRRAISDNEDVDKEILTEIAALNEGIKSVRVELGPTPPQGINYVEGTSREVSVG